MKAKCTRGFHSVEHPETGETIVVEEPFETDRETFELLREEYSGFMEVEESEGEYPVSEDGEPLCVGKEGGQCSRVVEEPGSVCWQH